MPYTFPTSGGLFNQEQSAYNNLDVVAAQMKDPMGMAAMGFGRALGTAIPGLFGVDVRSPAQKQTELVNKLLGQVDYSDPTSLYTKAREVAQYDPNAAIELVKLAQDAKALQLRRNGPNPSRANLSTLAVDEAGRTVPAMRKDDMVLYAIPGTSKFVDADTYYKVTGNRIGGWTSPFLANRTPQANVADIKVTGAQLGGLPYISSKQDRARLGALIADQDKSIIEDFGKRYRITRKDLNAIKKRAIERYKDEYGFVDAAKQYIPFADSEDPVDVFYNIYKEELQKELQRRVSPKRQPKQSKQPTVTRKKKGKVVEYQDPKTGRIIIKRQ